MSTWDQMFHRLDRLNEARASLDASPIAFWPSCFAYMVGGPSWIVRQFIDGGGISPLLVPILRDYAERRGRVPFCLDQRYALDRVADAVHFWLHAAVPE